MSRLGEGRGSKNRKNSVDIVYGCPLCVLHRSKLTLNCHVQIVPVMEEVGISYFVEHYFDDGLGKLCPVCFACENSGSMEEA